MYPGIQRLFTSQEEFVMIDGKQKDTNVTTDLARERTREAADRTLMAWIRTSLALIGFGFTVNKIIGVLEVGRPASPLHSTLVFALSFIALGIIGMLGAVIQHLWILRRLQMREFTYIAPTGLTLMVAILLVLVGFFSFIAVIFTR